MLVGSTQSGFEFEIDPEQLDDMEYVEKLAEIEENVLVLPKVIVMTLGEEGKKRLYDHLREDNGRVSVSKVSEEFTEILTIAGSKTKNS